jgi:hypothetical protein
MDVTTEDFLFLLILKTKSSNPINEHLEIEFGENVAEQRGWHWAITNFANDSWGKTEKDIY